MPNIVLFAPQFVLFATKRDFPQENALTFTEKYVIIYKSEEDLGRNPTSPPKTTQRLAEEGNPWGVSLLRMRKNL